MSGLTMQADLWDGIVVGGGPAELNAALVLGRCRGKVLLLDDGKPRNGVSHALHGFLSRDGIAPAQLRAIAREQLAPYASVVVDESRVVDAARTDTGCSVRTDDGSSLRARKLLLAGGVVDVLPDQPGFRELYGTAERHRERRAGHAVQRAFLVAALLVGAVGECRGRLLAAVRATRVLGTERRGLQQRHPGRGAGDHLRRSRADDARHEHGVDDGRVGSAGRMESSPSTYLQRLPLVALAFVGFVIARQLAAYQLGHVTSVWEPFFGWQGGRNGTETIITSDVSKVWPIADGGLGAVSYMLEVLMGVMGGRQRWRTMAWMVAAFGIVVVPLGVVSIYFIIIQPIVIGTWCTLCLIAAAAMVLMIPYTLDELVAMGQFLVQSHRRGEPFWRTFFMGGASPGSGRDQQPDFDAPLGKAVVSALRGVQVPWTLAVCALLGAGLMFTRLIFGTEPPMADSDHLVGALIVTVAVSAMAEVGRPLRFINVAFGLWLIAAPWVLQGASMPASAASIAVGIAVVALCLPRGRRSDEHYGSWDRLVL